MAGARWKLLICPEDAVTKSKILALVMENANAKITKALGEYSDDGKEPPKKILEEGVTLAMKWESVFDKLIEESTGEFDDYVSRLTGTDYTKTDTVKATKEF